MSSALGNSSLKQPAGLASSSALYCRVQASKIARAQAGYIVDCDNEWYSFTPPSPYGVPAFLDRMSVKQAHARTDLSCRPSNTDAQQLSAETINSSDAARPHASLNLQIAQVQSFGTKLKSIFTNPICGKREACGNGQEIMLQGFNWESHKCEWYKTISEQARWISQLGFTMIWLPPPTESVSPQGYLPRDLYNLNSSYGTVEDLKQCTDQCRRVGMKVIGDIILNHRCATYQNHEGVWNQFGGRLDWDARAILGNDPNFRGLGNHGEGEMFHAAPNIDHSQEFVRHDLVKWLKWLRGMGFDGWRLDFVRGFQGEYVKQYMQETNPYFAVGEFWDSLSYNGDGSLSYNQDSHRQRICDWVNAAGGLSTAFDITTKGILHAVFERSEYWRLKDSQGKPPGLIGWWPSRAVTFIENHDTGSTQGHWRFPDHGVEQGYVYILTHPGTPTVFYDHLVLWQRVRNVIQDLIEIRKRAGINSRSHVRIVEAKHDVYAAEIDSRLMMKIGPGQAYVDSSWELSACGHNWAVWERPLR